MTTTNILLIVGAVLLLAGWTVFRNLMRRRPSSPRGTFDDPDGERRVREDLQSLMVQMQEVAREQIAKADVKIRMLNQLLAEAEERKKELEVLLARAAQARRADEAVAPRSEPPKRERATNPVHEQIYSLQDQGKAVPDICAATGLETGEVEMILGLRKIR